MYRVVCAENVLCDTVSLLERLAWLTGDAARRRLQLIVLYAWRELTWRALTVNRPPPPWTAVLASSKQFLTTPAVGSSESAASVLPQFTQFVATSKSRKHRRSHVVRQLHRPSTRDPPLPLIVSGQRYCWNASQEECFFFSRDCVYPVTGDV